MSTPNPFAAPEADVVSRPGAPATGQWRKGAILHHPIGAQFADRCIRCNRPADGRRLRRRLVSFPELETRAVEIGLCALHRMMVLGATAGTSTVAAILFAWLLTGPASPARTMATFAAIVAAQWFWIGSRVIFVRHLDEHGARIEGVCEAYLRELPPP